ncbi:Hypothetical protein D9617_10g074490 [Elsinoe fawcettii]|nr:Hypothetical protein D9617_10g074490 [Elsinoe fawcettii]
MACAALDFAEVPLYDAPVHPIGLTYQDVPKSNVPVLTPDPACDPDKKAKFDEEAAQHVFGRCNSRRFARDARRKACYYHTVHPDATKSVFIRVPLFPLKAAILFVQDGIDCGLLHVQRAYYANGIYMARGSRLGHHGFRAKSWWQVLALICRETGDLAIARRAMEVF